jgi:hypothetical protein
MPNLIGRLIPVAVLIIIVGAFMASDKLWLHWYTPDTQNSEQHVQVQNTALPVLSPAPRTPAGGNGSESPTAASAQPHPSVNPTAQRAADRDAFAALWLVGQRATYRVRYETSSGGGENGDTYIIFNMPPNARVDTIPQGASDPSVQIAMDSSGKTLTCSTDGGSRDCVQVMGFSAPLPLSAGPIVFPQAATFGSLDITEVDGRTIASETTRCFSIASIPSDAASALDYCFDASGVPLYARGPNGVAEATELTTAVSDADFVLSP